MWPCKLCDSSLSTRYELLKHFRLRHFHQSLTGRYTCVYLDCPCTFISWKQLLTHTYRTHHKFDTAGAQSTTFSCQTCGCEELSTEKEYFSHINQHLRQYENVTCMFEGCTYQSNIYGTFNSHKNRKHNPHSLKDFKAGVVKVGVQSVSSPVDEEPTFTGDIDGSLSDADSDIDHAEDLPEVVEKKLASVLLKLENIFHVPSIAVDELVDELHYLLSTVSVSITCNSISDFFKRKNIEVDSLVIKELANSLCKTSPLTNALEKGGPLATAYKRKEYYKEVFNFVEPVEFLLDQKTSKSFQYIPLLRSLQQILDSSEVLNRVIDCHRTQGSDPDQLENQQYRSIRDGVYFKENPFLSGDELNICLTLYIDDFELCNPLGTSRKKHKLCGIYWILNNLGPGSHSALTSIYLAVLCKSNDVKTYGYRKVLEPLLHDLITLEEHGVYISKLGTFVKGTVHSVVADNLGAHGLAGFIESFSGHYICRFCTAQKEEIQSTDVYSGTFSLRTKEIHEAHLKTAQDTEKSCFGVKRACPLTQHLKHFHVSTGYPPDIVHDLFEGVVPFELALCLSILISKKYFTLASLNTCILKFPFKWSDKKNQPHQIPQTYSSRKTVGGNAHENWCLIRFLPFLIGDLIPEGELAWQVLLDLKEIVELAVAPVHTQETIAYLDIKVSEHRERLRELIPGETLKPKHHYLEHYAHLIMCFGPLVGVWTIRFEAKHSFFKQVARHTNNFRNIALTLATKHQQLISYHLHSSSVSTSKLEVTNVSTVPIDVLNEEVLVALRQKYPDISQVNLTKNVTTKGINYRHGMFVVYDSTAGMPEFAEILQICIVRDQLSFIVRSYFAWYLDHFRAFQLTLSPDRKVVLVQFEELRDCYPLVAYTCSLSEASTINLGSSSHEASDSDSCRSNDTIILSSPETRSCSWPKVFVCPRFSYCAEMMLQTGNNELNANGTLLSPTPKTRSDILEGLAEEIMKYTAYPKDEHFEEVAKALIQSHPCLLEKGTRSGYCGWKHYLKVKMMNFRSKLSRAGHPEVTVNSLKNKRKDQEKPAANIKKPRKAEVNFCPNIPSGETRESMEAERVALLTELKKKKKDEAEIKKKMQRTFSIRRQEVLQEPAISEFQNRWPALFDVNEINLEFMRLTTAPLTSKFLGELDHQTNDLIKVFNAKGGAAGRKITAIMAKMENNEDINVRRDCVLRCLSIYLNEDLDTLVKEYMEVNPLSSEEPEDTVGRVLASKSLHYAKDDSFRSNNKDACCGLSAYELQRLENIKEKEAFLSSLKIWQAAEDLRQSVKPKTHVKRSKALLVKEQFMHSPRKSLRLKEPQNLTLSEGSAHKHDIESREAEADIGEKTMGIYTVQAEVDVPGDGRFADVGVVLEGVKVLHNLQSVSHACVMLYGLIYALNLSYPKSLKSTFEVYQKILMDLDSSKLSPKVQALKLKLLQ